MLFKNIEEIKTALPIGVGNDINRLQPHIIAAQNLFIKPLLGDALFAELEDFHEIAPVAEPTPVQEATTQLLTDVQFALIHLAYNIGFDFLNVSVSDAGFMRMESDVKKTLFKYQEDALKKYFRDTGFNALDSILVYIESNIVHFNEFKLAVNWTELKESFLPTVRVIESIPFNIHNSRLIFLSLKPHIHFIEETVIKPLLGDTIFDEIKAEMIKDDCDLKVKYVLPHIRRPLIYLATAMLMEETGATLSERGLFFDKIQATYPSNTFSSHSDPSAIAIMVKRNRVVGNAWLDTLKSYLMRHPDWEYEATSNQLYNRDNSNKPSFFA